MNKLKPFILPALMAAAALACAGHKASAEPLGSGMAVTTQTGTVKTEILNLPKGRSAIVDLPVEARDVFVSNPTVADAVLKTPKRIFVLGVAPGQSDAIFFDGLGRQILNLSIRVDAPTDQLSETISRLFPGAQVEAQSLNGKILLSGMVSSNGEADQVQRLAASFVQKPEDVINMLSIRGQDQVMLKVRVAEVQRSTIKQLGFDTNAIIGRLGGGDNFTFTNSPGYSINGVLLGGLTGNYAQSNPASSGLSAVDATIEAFERVGLMRTLAEPNLTTVSGESAKFLAGGEFPVPTGQDNQGRISVEFKPFGVGLGFTPVVLSSGRIALKLSTEVSELSANGSISLTDTLNIPAISVRRVETSVEMASGSSLMIAGLLQSEYRQAVDALPGMTTLPVIGSLFRSRDFLNRETELVVIVTPYIVSPTRPDALQSPADNLQIAHDLSSTFIGNMNKVIKDRGGQPPQGSGGAGSGYQAPVGYVIE
ncbi:type II and III secretion system protein family protein [Asticcacaulis machinosus]|uniref:Type II and III secretion system protein family protein n=1 Tax=Asticcacaulis machinosus TaxID=2984211 RepID=A0ABT5HLJ9_9CAUL|nr:type II and III secretion system protein family protein [Asticcacaulis machinosus]MDC7677121.1 type II and III secretion system protein family protein [Asticcacaulis machinosus]